MPPATQPTDSAPEQEDTTLDAGEVATAAEQVSNTVEEPGPIDLAKLWSALIGALKPEHRDALLLVYGVQGEAPMTLQKTGDKVGLTRERVRQIKSVALQWLNAKRLAPYRDSMHGLLAQTRRYGRLITCSLPMSGRHGWTSA